jgi:hypothetical protein
MTFPPSPARPRPPAPPARPARPADAAALEADLRREIEGEVNPGKVVAAYSAALVHGHCHQKAVLRMDAMEQVLRGVGLDVEVLDSGCCGMAGSFGFEAGERYEVSVKVGEQVLLPAVRQAPEDALIVASGFSCREQIAQSTPRRALHPAQVLQMALREGPDGPRGDLPEKGYVEEPDGRREALRMAALLGAGAAMAAGLAGAAWYLSCSPAARERRRTHVEQRE